MSAVACNVSNDWESRGHRSVHRWYGTIVPTSARSRRGSRMTNPSVRPSAFVAPKSRSRAQRIHCDHRNWSDCLVRHSCALWARSFRSMVGNNSPSGTSESIVRMGSADINASCSTEQPKASSHLVQAQGRRVVAERTRPSDLNRQSNLEMVKMFSHTDYETEAHRRS
jgi:hypothetical protein